MLTAETCEAGFFKRPRKWVNLDTEAVAESPHPKPECTDCGTELTAYVSKMGARTCTDVNRVYSPTQPMPCTSALTDTEWLARQDPTRFDMADEILCN